MKILILNIYQGGVLRGAERFVDEFSRRLKKNHNTIVVSGGQKQVKRWPILWRFFLDPSGIRICIFTLKNISKILKDRPDIVIPLNSGWMPFWIRLVTWLYGGKMVITGHAGIGWDDRVNLWSFPNVFVAISEKAEKWAMKANPFLRVVYIPHGIDMNVFNPVGSKLKTGLKEPIILCVGALEKNKRIDLVIKAVAKVEGASLLVVGDGELRTKLAKLGKNLMGDRFRLTKASFDEMSKIYRTADLFTLVSMPQYSFEMVLLEAMATNLPVVATNDPIRKEIVGNAGILVEPTEIEKYTRAIKEALDKDWRNKPRKQAEKYDWDKIVKKYEGLFIGLPENE